MKIECQHCETPIAIVLSEESDGEVGCDNCSSRHAWRLHSGLSEDGEPLISVTRWWCPHGIVDFQDCTPCEALNQ